MTEIAVTGWIMNTSRRATRDGSMWYVYLAQSANPRVYFMGWRDEHLNGELHGM